MLQLMHPSISATFGGVGVSDVFPSYFEELYAFLVAMQALHSPEYKVAYVTQNIQVLLSLPDEVSRFLVRSQMIKLLTRRLLYLGIVPSHALFD